MLKQPPATVVEASGYLLISMCRFCYSSVVGACVAVPPSDTILWGCWTYRRVTKHRHTFERNTWCFIYAVINGVCGIKDNCWQLNSKL